VNRGHLILLVEDSEEDAELASRALKEGSALNEIVLVRDGVEALDYLFGTPGRVEPEAKTVPALILLDLSLPKIGGLALLRRLRDEELTRRIPIVILTGSRAEQDIASSHDLGANRFIAKPVTFKQLDVAARQLGLHRLVGGKPPNP
jgi:two-component system, response regulator